MLRNLLFDLAGVVMNLNIERDTEALSAAGFPCFEECCRNPLIRKPMLTFLNGLCSEQEFFSNIRGVCRESVSDDELRWAMNAVLDDIPRERIERIIALRKHYRTYLLTNIYTDAWQHALNEVEGKGYRMEDIFDRVFLSYELKLAKPDVRIFQHVIDVTGIKPEETLFFDDNKDNTTSAQAMGFNTCLVPCNKLEDSLLDAGMILDDSREF